MARRPSGHPTELELEILKIFWRTGQATVGQVRDALVGFRELAYTSVMTIMTIMTRKGYLARQREGGSYVYEARITEKSITQTMLKDIVDRVFEGSTAAVMVNLLETKDLDPDELKQLRNLINQKIKGEQK
jgi:BlaI family transcriptional regulator, penicillinase repressor